LSISISQIWSQLLLSKLKHATYLLYIKESHTCPPLTSPGYRQIRHTASSDLSAQPPLTSPGYWHTASSYTMLSIHCHLSPHLAIGTLAPLISIHCYLSPHLAIGTLLSVHYHLTPRLVIGTLLSVHYHLTPHLVIGTLLSVHYHLTPHLVIGTLPPFTPFLTRLSHYIRWDSPSGLNATIHHVMSKELTKTYSGSRCTRHRILSCAVDYLEDAIKYQTTRSNWIYFVCIEGRELCYKPHYIASIPIHTWWLIVSITIHHTVI